MDADFGAVNWSSDQHEILLNPRWPRDDLLTLRSGAERILKSHATEPSLVLSSSGTSAGSWREIKLILLSKRAVLAGARAVSEHFRFSTADRLGDPLPAFHVGGLSVSARAFVSGAARVDLRPRERWTPEDFRARAAGERVSVASLVPTQLHDVVERGLSPWPELRVLFVGGGALAPSLEEKARRAGWPLVLTYGMTETSAMIAVRAEPDGALHFRPLDGVIVSLTDEGLIKIQSPSLADGFARLTERGELLWTPIDRQGFVTEDHGRMYGDRFEVRGRGRDQVKINGENVNLNALRRIMDPIALALNVAPADWHLIARPDERHGHVIVLAVRRGVDGALLKKEFDRRTIPFENIRRIHRVADIPRTELGKVREELLLREIEAQEQKG